MIISANPYLSINKIKSLPVNVSLPSYKVRFFPNGRNSLIYSLMKLSVPINSKILLPAYICSSIPNILEDHGYRPVFIDVNDDLTLSFSEIKKLKKNESISVVLLVDYFGFIGQRNIKLAREIKNLGLIVIIDRCHSSILLPNIEFQSKSIDAIIYSLRKTIPVRDGGLALLSNDPSVKSINIGRYNEDFLFFIAKYLEKIICKIGFPNIYSSRFVSLKNHIRKIFQKKQKQNIMKVMTHSKLYLKSYSYLLHLHLNNIDYMREIAEKRRKNYKIYKNKLLNISYSLLFPEITDTSVPQVIPLIDESESLVKSLREKSIGAYRWPANEIPMEVSINSKLYPNSIRLNDKIACLPVHQDMTEEKIEYIVSIIKNQEYKKT